MYLRIAVALLSVAMLSVAVISPAYIPASFADEETQLNGPNVSRRDRSSLLTLRGSKTKIIVGKKIKDKHGKATCAYTVKLTRNPGDPPQAAQQLAFDPDTCKWEVEFGSIEAREIPGTSGGKIDTVSAKPDPAAPGSEDTDIPPETDAIQSAQGAFTAVTLDPIGLKVNEVSSRGFWDYDSNQFRIVGHRSECTYWWLSESGWWKHSSNCSEQVNYGDFKTIANAHYKNRAFCNPTAETNVQYQGVTFKGTGNGGKQGWVDALWADGDCSGLLWHNSFLL